MGRNRIFDRRWTRGVLLAAALGVGAAPASAATTASTEETGRVVVLANADDPESVTLAAEYALARGIPAANVLAWPMPREETVSWPVFVRTIYNPAKERLLAGGWLRGIDLGTRDAYDRVQVAISEVRPSYLVVMRGVPLRIREERAWVPATPPLGVNPTFLTTQAAVDSELALIAAPDAAIVAFLPNPLLRGAKPGALRASQVVRVARLDGPTPTAVRGMMRGALVAEKGGLAGRAYVDTVGPHPLGDRWLERVARRCETLGFPTTVQRSRGAFAAGDAVEDAALYFGWYEENVNGPFAEAGFRFSTGAIAIHIHSFSARTLRNAERGWSGPLVERGAAVTIGNVWEPYLQLSHHVDAFLDVLAEGGTVGEAAYASLPALSWQSIVLGDPLYRPFRGRAGRAGNAPAATGTDSAAK